MRIPVNLNEQTSSKLIDLATAEKRSACSQAEVLIMHALGTWEPDLQVSGIQAKSIHPKLKQKGGGMTNV